MTQIIFSITFALFSSAAFAVEAEDILGDCKSTYETELEMTKIDFLKSSPWNYDNDYDLSHVGTSKGYDIKKNGSFKVDIYLDIEGLREQSYTYIFTPKFKAGKCDDVDVEDPIIN